MRRPVAVSLLLALAACGHSIGDSCHTNVDCSPSGDRFCDTSSTGGYCSIDGCDVNTCPSEAVCIRFLTPQLGEPCNDGNPQHVCRVDERCVCNNQEVSGQCDLYYCAPESSERRWCMKGCSSDGDCRSGYRCAYTGEFGGNTVPTFDMGPAPNRYCAPSGPISTH